ncbi:MAG: tRNA (adenine(22)-N(1))-methyltransferase TrmK [Bacteroidales bacterium]|nr:tRNA (adenine(22)-N(1))-methyltransferase TrmK [Bacteroidales bacterium]
MSAPFFHFRQFSITQDKAAMKISTDGVLLGAVCEFNYHNKILDIGTGTGLISLMAAQKSNAEISAVEIDQDAYIQAKENVEKSKFTSRIKVLHGDFLQLFKDSTEKFDYVVSNPPFFRNSLKNNDKGRSIARHEDALPFEKMIPIVAKILSDGGIFSVIIPESERLYFVRLGIASGLHICEKFVVKSFIDSEPQRVILSFSNVIKPLKQDTIVIYSSQGVYTEQFKSITKDFYLNV